MYQIFDEIVNYVICNKKIPSEVFPKETDKQIELFKLLFQNRCFYTAMEFCESNGLPPVYKLLIKKGKKEIKDYLQSTSFMQHKFEEGKIEYSFVKGPFLSYLIYGTLYARQFDDIDCFVASNNIIQVCNIIEACGFSEPIFKYYLMDSLSSQEEYFEMKNKLILTAYELHYQNAGEVFELKRQTSLFKSNIVGDALKRTKNYICENMVFRSFDIPYTFLYLLSNMVDNFYTYWGIYACFYVRDILDLCMFVSKYSLLYEDEFKQIIEKYNMEDYFMRCKLIVKGYIRQESYLILPRWFRDTEYFLIKKNEFQDWILDDLKKYVCNKNMRVDNLYNYIYIDALINAKTICARYDCKRTTIKWNDLEYALAPCLISQLPKFAFFHDSINLFIALKFDANLIKFELNFRFLGGYNDEVRRLEYITNIVSLEKTEINYLERKCTKKENIGIAYISFKKIEKLINENNEIFVYVDFIYKGRKIVSIGRPMKYCRLIISKD